ncbi:hypothetical protein MLD38_037014 [Melastoma candidum]|uniref:Uncharacterized protein n=1 Tax=Melastoma candidum TaxID=119954 RepID=A0ACB9LMG3_9MYRT|nr:hypothetical protein MLD38_037014 [Melastoma candidum]
MEVTGEGGSPGEGLRRCGAWVVRGRRREWAGSTVTGGAGKRLMRVARREGRPLACRGRRKEGELLLDAPGDGGAATASRGSDLGMRDWDCCRCSGLECREVGSPSPNLWRETGRRLVGQPWRVWFRSRRSKGALEGGGAVGIWSPSAWRLGCAGKRWSRHRETGYAGEGRDQPLLVELQRRRVDLPPPGWGRQSCRWCRGRTPEVGCWFAAEGISPPWGSLDWPRMMPGSAAFCSINPPGIGKNSLEFCLIPPRELGTDNGGWFQGSDFMQPGVTGSCRGIASQVEGQPLLLNTDRLLGVKLKRGYLAAAGIKALK